MRGEPAPREGRLRLDERKADLRGNCVEPVTGSPGGRLVAVLQLGLDEEQQQGSGPQPIGAELPERPAQHRGGELGLAAGQV